VLREWNTTRKFVALKMVRLLELIQVEGGNGGSRADIAGGGKECLVLLEQGCCYYYYF
jgi:hypothetical protein